MSTHQEIGIKRGRTTRPRIVLLLDLDCFYAQCETVRLGLDKSLPLCLLQWNSALAVNYPARAFGIKRGDGFDEIGKKSQGQCVSLHLPVISVEDITTPPHYCFDSGGAGCCCRCNMTLKEEARTQSSTSANEKAPTSKIASPKTEAASSSHDADLECARRLQATLNESASAPRSEGIHQPQREAKSSEDPDLEYARRLQASFDTEERMLSALDRSGGAGGGGGRKSGHGSSSRHGSGSNGGAKGAKRQKKSSSSALRKNGNGGGSVAPPSSKMKIDNFFSVKKKK